jgi:hypothetical protein
VALLRIVVAVLVIVVWGALYGKYILVAGTPPPPAEVSGLMLAVVTWLLAGAARAASGSSSEALRRRFAEWLLGSKRDGRGDGDGARAPRAQPEGIEGRRRPDRRDDAP